MAKIKDWKRMAQVKVLFVCLGNICRSPLAEGIFRQKVSKRGLADQFKIHSCGTAAYHIGEHPDKRSVANAKKNGVEYDHLGRQFKAKDFHEFDLILAMDEYNYADIERLKPKEATTTLKMMRSYDETEPDANVPDPYYGGEDGFQEVFDILDRSTEKLLNELIEKFQIST